MTYIISKSTDTNNRERIERAVIHWHSTLQAARTQLFSQQWSLALPQYQNAYRMAEQLLRDSLCKNCAMKGYSRTLIELAYVLRKSHQHQQLPIIIAMAKESLETGLSPGLANELSTIVDDIANAPIVQIDAWINNLFAMDSTATSKHRLH